MTTVVTAAPPRDRRTIMTELMYLLGSPCVRCEEDLPPSGIPCDTGTETQRMLCPDHFHNAAAEHFTLRGNADPAPAADEALSQGLHAVSLPCKSPERSSTDR
ncbi:hypothetical protein ABTX60_36745 [Streptomyces sp. NPDC126510]|uniref:hypothetical protein n=1 Tax=Streptomyces sp. NPDC126510 TaxID=3155317 RepID=UPI00333407DD